MYINKLKIVVIGLSILFLISGCGVLSKPKNATKDDSVDYKNARSIPALKLPTK